MFFKHGEQFETVKYRMVLSSRGINTNRMSRRVQRDLELRLDLRSGLTVLDSMARESPPGTVTMRWCFVDIEEVTYTDTSYVFETDEYETPSGGGRNPSPRRDRRVLSQIAGRSMGPSESVLILPFGIHT
jgi:hypothetical protein